MKHLLMAALIIAFLLNPLTRFSVQATPDFTCADVTEIPQIECEALVALYYSTNGSGWNDNAYFWLANNTPSTWYGVTVESGHVTGLLLSLLQLTGTIPPEIGNLSRLTSLDLSWNYISGMVPAEIGNLTSLQTLWLNQNKLYGDVPDSFLKLINLSNSGYGLSLDNNTLNVPPGYPDPTIPLHVFLYQKDPDWHLSQTTVFSCADVTEVPQIECEALVALYTSTTTLVYTPWLSNNTPSTWGGLVIEAGHVVEMRLGLQSLTGFIPPELGNLSQLRVLEMGFDSMTGIIPPELGKLVNLEFLYLGYNELDGDVPESLINLVNLDVLGLDYNTLNVPPGYPDLSNPFHVFLYQRDPDWHLHQYMTTCAEVTEIPLIECEALAALYSSTHGDTWMNNSGWLATNMPSGWYGVTVEAGHVTRLDLHENLLSGSLPPELANLSSLSSLRLYSNQLSGSLPAELGNMSSLTELWLFKNQFSGSIPPELGNLSSLVNLSLWSNQFSGSIPPALGQLNCLEQLDLSYNLLSGAIPPQLGELSSLTSLTLKYNQFSSSIPPELGNLSSLHSLSLSDNRLSGVIPPDLGQLSNLTNLYLYGNELSGVIPAELGALSALKELYLASNLLTGPIPPALGNLGSLEILNLYHNQLNGVLPPELGNLGSLKWLHLASNQLSGSLPSTLGSLSSLEWLILSDNQLTGSIPAELGNLSSLTDLSLADNQLSGTIPTEIGNLTNLRMLHLNQNSLNGDIPATFTNLINLFAPGTYGENGDGLDLDYNALNIPANYPDPAVPLQVFLWQQDPDWHLYQAFEQVISSEGGVLTSLDGSVEFVVPEGTLDADTTFAFTPQPETGYDTGWLSFTGSSFQMTAEDTGGLVTTFDPPLTVTLYYSDADLGSTPEKSLALYYWDVDKNAWVDAITTCPGGTYTRDLAGNTLSLPLCHLSEFAMLGEPYRSLLPVVQVSR